MSVRARPRRTVAVGRLPLAVPHWTLDTPPDRDRVRRLAADLGLPELVCRVLVARGFDGEEVARAYLRPLIEHLHDPTLLADADRAVTRLEAAIRSGERILVHGDYDVDGIAAAALLSSWLERLGARVQPFVPHRLKDGYDFGPAGLAAARALGASLIVTADCGTVAFETVDEAAGDGIDVIVTDHHTPGDRLPAAVAVVNPKRADCSYPNEGLCGTGVAFKLCQLLASRHGLPDDELWPSLDLVALATVADLVPLEGENRALVRIGLRALARTARPGLRALIDRSGLEGTLDAGQVGFILAPPINAAGRVDDAKLGLALLTSDDQAEADGLAGRLLELNRERRDEDDRTLTAAVEVLSETYRPSEHFGVVVSGEGWHPGVIGIVASRLVERIHRPVVVVALDGVSGRGSARSIPGFDLYASIHSCRDLLDRYGGHRQAAGLDVRRDRVPALKDAFNRVAQGMLAGVEPRPAIRADVEVSLAELTADVHRYLRYAGPFGIGNRRPVFLSRSVRQVQPPKVAGANHLKLSVEQDGTAFPAIGFGLADRMAPASLGAGPVDLLFQLRENHYRGRTTLQLRLLDVRPAGGPIELA